MFNTVEIFKALAEESRLRILALLMQDEMCVCEIEACLNMTQSNASRHLTALRKSGILDSYKKAQWAYYKIDNSFIENNPDLYAYLQKELKHLPCYKSDCEKWGRCKEQDLCKCEGKK
jgi:ArsR family transcriptional regulator